MSLSDSSSESNISSSTHSQPRSFSSTSSYRRKRPKQGQKWEPSNRRRSLFQLGANITKRRTPYSYKFVSTQIRDRRLYHRYFDAMVRSETRKCTHSGASARQMLEILYPTKRLPFTLDDILLKLHELGYVSMSNQKSGRRTFLFAPVWVDSLFSGKETETSEALMAKFLDDLCTILESFLPRSMKRNRRYWNGDFSSLPPKSDGVDIQRKPDLVALRKEFLKKRYRMILHRLRWLNIDLVGELKSFIASETKFLEEIIIDTDNKAFCIFASQPHRRFLPFPTITDRIVRLSLYDRGVAIHSKGFDMHKKPRLFLHLLIYLTFASDEEIGYDPTFQFVGKECHILVKGKKYVVEKEIFRNPMIEGRATSCYFVKFYGKHYALKDVWIITKRKNSEVFFLTHARLHGVLSGIPELLEWEDVKVNRRVDSCEKNRGVWPPFVDRTHRRLVFKTRGIPLWHFRTLKELLSALVDCVKTHKLLVIKAGILHRDISINNILLVKEGTYPRKGFLIDFDWATILKEWKEKQKATDKENVPTADGKGETRSSKAAKVIMDMSADDDSEDVRGHRTGTFAFMSHELLQDDEVEHDVHHDMDSFFYIILFMSVMFVGPNDKQRKDAFPNFLSHWMKPTDEDTLGGMKSGMINSSDELFERKYLAHVTEYFSCLKPLLMQLRNRIKSRTLTHDTLIEHLKDAIKSLVFETVQEPENELSTESPLDAVLLADDLVHSKEIKSHADLRGLGRINGPGTAIKGVASAEAACNVQLPPDTPECSDEEELGVGKIPSLFSLAKGRLRSGSKDDSFLNMNL